MSSNIQEQIEILRASVTEGRVENVRYRQDQLFALHNTLLETADEISQAIKEDSGCSLEDAETEFYLGMDALRKSYEALDFDQALKDEYLVANGKSNEDKRVALGLITIKAAKHSPFYSVVVAIAAAVAAGNCVLLELDDSSPAVNEVLRKNLSSALDQDTFQISSQVNEEMIKEVDLLVDQTHLPHNSSIKTVSSPQTRAIAIIDRSCSIEVATKAIVEARISARGLSPYSPDLVIINEFIGEQFRTACLKYAEDCGQRSTKSDCSAGAKTTQNLLEKLESDSSIKMHRLASTELVVVEILDRKSPLVRMKIDGPYILTLQSTSLVDSVDSQRNSTPFLACYLFASLATCKFLSEQVSSYVTYINHIPAQLLVGPSSPLGYPHSLHPRYTNEMFSSPRPKYLTRPESLPATDKLKAIALKKLMPTGQRPGHAIGFFEQGILIGLGSTVIVVLPLIGWSLFTLVKHGLKFWNAKMH